MNRLFTGDNESVGRIHDQLGHLVKIMSGVLPDAGSAQPLTRDQLAAFIETAFWASLRANEGRTTRFCAALVSPENFQSAVAFAAPAPYDEEQIVKLAPGVPSGGCFTVSPSDDGFSIWGFGRSRPETSIDTVTIDIFEPGTVRVGVGPFQPFAVLDGRSDSILTGTQTNLAQYLRHVLRKVFPADDILEAQAVWRECLAVGDLARLIVADGHGGTILIVPGETGDCFDSLNPFAYRFAVPDTTIRDAIRRELNDVAAQGAMIQRVSEMAVSDDVKNAVMGALPHRPIDIGSIVRPTASLAAVDGAVVMTKDLQVLGFGAHIAIASDAAATVCIFRSEPGQQAAVPLPLEALGGTRHQSAARFAGANKAAVALVISQDRHMSVVHWHGPIGSVAVVRNAEWWV